MSKDVFEMCSNDFSWSHVFQAMASWFSAGSGGDVVGLCCIREDESSEHQGKLVGWILDVRIFCRYNNAIFTTQGNGECTPTISNYLWFSDALWHQKETT